MTTDAFRCPACSALLRPGVSWCSLCHADLRTEEEIAASRPPVPEPLPEVPYTVPDPLAEQQAAPAPGTTLTVAAEPAGRGRHARPAPAAAPTADIDETAILALTSAAPAVTMSTRTDDPRLAGVDVAGMLAELAREEDPLVVGLNSQFGSRSQRTVATLVGVVVVGGACVIALFVLGALVH